MALLQLAALLLLAGGPCYAVKIPIAWDIPYKGLAKVPAVSGDTVSFRWNTNSATLAHDVFKFNGAGNYKTCTTTAATGASLTAKFSKHTYTTKALTPGTYYYSCSVPGHCSAGKQKVTVNVAVNWAVKTKAITVNMKANETLFFKWGDDLAHDLVLLKWKNAYDTCATTTATISKTLVASKKKATFKYGPLAKGTYYLACSIPGHCRSGQKLSVVVT